MSFNFSEPVLISQGAEGKVYALTFLSKPSILKERVSKSYRVKELDQKINKQRLLQEARCMIKCRRAGVTTPSIYFVNQQNHTMVMERILGKTLKDIFKFEELGGKERGL